MAFVVIDSRHLHLPTNMATNITFHPGNITSEERNTLLGQKGLTLWLTGLSASGKVCLPMFRGSFAGGSDTQNCIQSTIASALEQHLVHLKKFAYRLDGDNIRFGLNKDLGFSEADRNENIRRIGEASGLSRPSLLLLFLL